MTTSIINELHIPFNDTLTIVGHYNLDRDTDCFVISYHINNSEEPSEMYIPVRYFLRKTDAGWENGNYDEHNTFEPFSDPYTDRIKTYLLEEYYA
ncbi:hypothetical protein ACTHGU_20445 [Chitinophagaceae bacterium MMS25-I14]